MTGLDDKPAAAPISKEVRISFWLGGLLVVLLLLYLLRSILLPFVAGMAVAYLLDPLACRLERLGLSRLWATITMTLVFLVLAVAGLFLVAPLLQDQMVHFVQRVPGYITQLLHRGAPLWGMAQNYLSPADIAKLRGAAWDYAGTVVGWIGELLGTLLTGSLALANLLSLIFITPMVIFYFLRDWHGMTRQIDTLLPTRYAETIRVELKAIDHILSGWVRGQATVCLALALLYGIGLSLVGLDLGLVVGLSAGLLSFVPYLGTIAGFVVGVGLALAQSQEWKLAAMVAAVFIVGNLLESNLLAPRLVGKKIGLHPVWVIFALLAGGALFGFLGVLLAFPAAAVIGVLTKFALQQYLASPLYNEPDLPP